ncbi:c-type cytochrome [Thioalkalivibrio sp. HK1]|uniref:c-type cytochrome n=1 Tax=Thioalkalivibrio sp. HK1 TaxID=1469245 RepID=UPI0004708473|nr:cytochrome c [Thioalkalivibrio sp. HK1]
MRFQAIRIFTASLAAVAAISAIVAFVRGAPVARADIQPLRWYDASRVSAGKEIYGRHCAGCHGPSAQSVSSWRQRNADGRLPPPPLDGSAHTWHHPLLDLAQRIKYGTPGGRMPGFEDRLSDRQIIDVIAWIQNLWPDRIYRQWWKIQQVSQYRSRQGIDRKHGEHAMHDRGGG